MRVLAAEHQAAEERARAIAAQQAQDSEREANRRAAAAEASRLAQERQRQIVLNRRADLAIGSGIVSSRQEFDRLSAGEISEIVRMEVLADSLQSDIVAAFGQNATAEKAVAIGRPASTGASIVSLLNGYGWAGLAFGAAAVGARWMANDWKRSKEAEFRARWAGHLSALNRAQLELFSRIVVYKYPALSQIVASQGNFLG